MVIGSGPAGQKAAIQAAKAGKRVAVIERDRQVGGSCVHTGTIPSKSLREHALRQRVRRVDLMDEPIQSLLDGVGRDHRRARRLHGRAARAQPHRAAARPRELRRRRTSSRMRRIDGSQATRARAHRHHRHRLAAAHAARTCAVDHEHVLDSDSILSLAYLPRSLLVLGGGVIASEYAAMFAALGCKVTQADQLRSAAGLPRSRAHRVLPR